MTNEGLFFAEKCSLSYGTQLRIFRKPNKKCIVSERILMWSSDEWVNPFNTNLENVIALSHDQVLSLDFILIVIHCLGFVRFVLFCLGIFTE